MQDSKQQTAAVQDAILHLTLALRDGADEFTVEVSVDTERPSGYTTHSVYEAGDRLTSQEADEVALRFGYGDSAEMAAFLVSAWHDGKFGPDGARDEYPL
jgi:hypothetical protein